MSQQPKPGEVCLSQALAWNRGQMVANDGQKIVSILLGTVEDDQDPDIEGRLNRLGWFAGNHFEVRTDTGIRTIYASGVPEQAVVDGIRFLQALPDEFNEATIHAVRIAGIDDLGNARIGRSGTIFGWSKDGPETLDEVKERLCGTTKSEN